MRRNHWPNGGAKVGFIPKIRAAGSNGIAGTTVDAAMKMICAKSRVGVRFAVTWRS